jgi:hypothetical protein
MRKNIQSEWSVIQKSAFLEYQVLQLEQSFRIALPRIKNIQNFKGCLSEYGQGQRIHKPMVLKRLFHKYFSQSDRLKIIIIERRMGLIIIKRRQEAGPVFRDAEGKEYRKNGCCIQGEDGYLPKTCSGTRCRLPEPFMQLHISVKENNK